MRNLPKGRDDGELHKMLRCFVDTGGDMQAAANLAVKQMPWIIHKTGVSGTEVGDLVGGFETTLGGEFLASLEHGGGIFDSIRPYTRRAGLRTRIFTPTAPIVAAVSGEGVAIPISRFSLDAEGLAPQKVAALAVIANEALSLPEGAEWLAEELRQAVTLATDAAVFARLVADYGAAETSSGNPSEDIRVLLDLVNLSGFGRLFLCLHPEQANALSTMVDVAGGLLFPDMSPQGGIICGVPAVVSGGVTSGSVALVDAGGLVTGDEDLKFKLTTNAMIEMSDAPAGDGTDHVVSLFQADAVGVLATRTIAVKALRASSVAVLTGAAAWGEVSS